LAQALLGEIDRQVTDRRENIGRLVAIARVGVAAGVFAALLALVLYSRQTRELQRAEEDKHHALEAERDALESQVRERTARLTELATHLQQAVEEERAHLARELHDELGALLTAAKLDVARLRSRLPADATDQLERLKHLTDTLNQGIALKRR
ncbi:MAG: histidine kinase, partial [Ottowia sp.]|nr:histidine kinase [Ottowia sp.]